MANTFNLDLGNVATLAATLVGADFNLASFITADLSAEYAKGQGSTVSIAVPGSAPSHVRGIGDRTTPLIVDDITEQHIDVTLTDHVYSASALSEADESLNIKDFGAQVLAPQARAISTAVEARVASTMSATPTNAAVTYASATPAKSFTAARKLLRANGVPDSARLIAAVGTDIYGDILDAPAGSGFDADGKIRGFEVVESTRLNSKDAIFFIPEAFALVARAPEVPLGASYGASVVTPLVDANRGKRFSVRVVVDYDPLTASDRALTSSFIAVQALPLPVDNGDGTVTLKANGAAIRVRAA